MNINDMYPRKYASGLDLDGRAVTVTIAGIKKESMRPPGAGPVEKYVLYFRETPRGVVLTRILAGQIAAAVGTDETDQWTGKRITLYPETIPVAGQQRTVIRATAARVEKDLPREALTVNSEAA